MPLVIAHRGASAEAPENTLASFRLAWQHNADGIEGDYHLSRDKQLVCIHDTTLLRTGGIDRAIADMTLAEIQQVDVGSWHSRPHRGERAPTIAEVLATVPVGRKAYIELKDDPAGLYALAEAADFLNFDRRQIVILSFQAEVVEQVKSILPGAAALYTIAFERDSANDPWRPTADELVDTCRKIAVEGIDIEARRDAITPDFVRTIRAAGLELHAWTVNDAPTAIHLINLGFDSLTTDHPAWLKRLLEVRERE